MGHRPAAHPPKGSKTVVVEYNLGGQPCILGAEVTDETEFGERAKGLAEVKAGGQVTLQWVRHEKGGVVRSVTLR